MFSFSRSVHVFYASILTLAFIATIVGLNFLWSDGPVRMDHIFSMVESSYEIESMKNENTLGEVRSLVESDQSREALTHFRDLEERVIEINRIQSDENFKELRESNQQTYSSIESMISLPEASKIISVLSSKVESFENFVVNNNWRTLTRISGRVSARLDYDESQRKSFFTQQRLERLHSSLSEDFERMQSVTTNSILSQDNKDRILNQIDGMMPELEMLSNYIAGLESFNQNISMNEMKFESWLSSVSLGLNERMSDFQRMGGLIFFGLLSLCAFIFLSLIGGFMVYSQNHKKNKRKIEEISLQTIRDGLIPLESNLSKEFSSEFGHELEKFREYIHKRMSFGSVFQEGMPFSTIMLDNNLNLSWANSLFYEVWGLEQRTAKEEPLSWDYLQQFTNLGEDDPVLMALNDNVAGIYQIQVKTREDSEGLPYEMYVSPVDYAGQSRIMIFFYPLRSIQETISHQVRSIVGPVGRTLDLLASDGFEGEDSKSLKKDFEIAGIENLFEKFCSYDEIVKSQRQKLDRELHRLNSLLEHEEHRLKKIDHVIEEQKKTESKIQDNFVETKNAIISTSEVRESMEEIYRVTSQDCREVFKEQRSLFSICEGLSEVLTDSLKSYDKICQTSKELKAKKEELDRQRTRIIQSVEQTMVYQRVEGQDPKLTQTLSKVKSDVKSFDKTLTELSKSVTSVDVALSRLDMMMSGVVIPDLDVKKVWFDDMNEAIETQMFNMGRMENEGRESEEKIVETLKSFHMAFKDLKQLMKESQKIIHEESVKEASFNKSFNEESNSELEESNEAHLEQSKVQPMA